MNSLLRELMLRQRNSVVPVSRLGPPPLVFPGRPSIVAARPELAVLSRGFRRVVSSGAPRVSNVAVMVRGGQLESTPHTFMHDLHQFNAVGVALG
eukprot:2378718-Pyramimonas_sp.AAC.1